MALPETFALTNPGFESGLTGWTQARALGTTSAASWSAATSGYGGLSPRTGSYLAWCSDSGGSGQLYQDIDISGSSNLTAIDAGTVAARFSIYQADTAPPDIGRIGIAFYDGSGNKLAEYRGPLEQVATSWTLREITAPVPPSTRTVRLFLEAYYHAGTSTNVYWDAAQDLELLDAALYHQITQDIVHAIKGGGQPRITQDVVQVIKGGGQPRISQDLLHVLFDPNSAASGHGRRRMVVVG